MLVLVRGCVWVGGGVSLWGMEGVPLSLPLLGAPWSHSPSGTAVMLRSGRRLSPGHRFATRIKDERRGEAGE